jgi:acyl-CoA thioesterase FadM
MTFEQRFQLGWSHLDSNAHMRKTAYVDLAADVRVAYLAAAPSPQHCARSIEPRTSSPCRPAGPSRRWQREAP